MYSAVVHVVAGAHLGGSLTSVLFSVRMARCLWSLKASSSGPSLRSLVTTLLDPGFSRLVGAGSVQLFPLSALLAWSQ
eukprot:1506219-Pyramimonas_sp.AAC.3